MNTYCSQTAGSNTIMPSGKTLTFAGPRGGIGVYVTEAPDEIEWLDGLCSVKTSQIFKPDSTKQVDFSVQAATAEVRERAEFTADPAKTAELESAIKLGAGAATTTSTLSFDGGSNPADSLRAKLDK